MIWFCSAIIEESCLSYGKNKNFGNRRGKLALRCLNVEKDNDYFYHEVFSQEGGILLYLMFVLLKGIFICSSCLFLSDSFGGIEWAKGYHLQYLWLEIVVFTFIYWVFYVVDKPHSFFSKIYSVLSFIFFVIPCNSYLGLSNCGIYFWIYAHLYVILFLLATRILDRIAYPTFVVGREKAVIKSDNLKVLTYTISCAFFCTHFYWIGLQCIFLNLIMCMYTD